MIIRIYYKAPQNPLKRIQADTSESGGRGIMWYKCCYLHRVPHVCPLIYLQRPSPEKAVSSDLAERNLI